jgi:hypothetical protein
VNLIKPLRQVAALELFLIRGSKASMKTKESTFRPMSVGEPEELANESTRVDNPAMAEKRRKAKQLPMDELPIRNREGTQAVLTPAFAPHRRVEAPTRRHPRVNPFGRGQLLPQDR